MLDLKFVRDNLDLIAQSCADRQAKVDLSPLAEMENRRRQILPELETLRKERLSSICHNYRSLTCSNA